MAVATPALIPLFRSAQQMRLLAEIFHGQPAAGAELARRLKSNPNAIRVGRHKAHKRLGVLLEELRR